MSHHKRLTLVSVGLAAIAWIALAGAAVAQTPPPGGESMTLQGYFLCPAVVEPAHQSCPFELHYVDLRAGRTYAIRLESPAVDARLTLEDLSGRVLGDDTENAEELEGWIVYRATATERYRLIAQPLSAVRNGSEGHYMIMVIELPVMMEVRGEHEMPAATGTNINLVAGRRYIIDMQSDELEPFVKLLNANGAVVAFNDEGWLGRPARIVFVAPRTETYRIVATNAGPRGVGLFRVTVCEK